MDKGLVISRSRTTKAVGFGGWYEYSRSILTIITRHHYGWVTLGSQGLVLQGGPFLGKSGGIMIFKANMEVEKITELANDDPAIKKGVLDFEIKPWLRVFGD